MYDLVSDSVQVSTTTKYRPAGETPRVCGITIAQQLRILPHPALNNTLPFFSVCRTVQEQYTVTEFEIQTDKVLSPI